MTTIVVYMCTCTSSEFMNTHLNIYYLFHSHVLGVNDSHVLKINQILIMACFYWCKYILPFMHDNHYDIKSRREREGGN